MYFSQQIFIGFLGANPGTKYRPNGTPAVGITDATKKSWKDLQTDE